MDANSWGPSRVRRVVAAAAAGTYVISKIIAEDSRVYIYT